MYTQNKTKIQQLQSRGVDQNMEQVLVDLQQVKSENASLEKDLAKQGKKKSSKKEKSSVPADDAAAAGGDGGSAE